MGIHDPVTRAEGDARAYAHYVDRPARNNLLGWNYPIRMAVTYYAAPPLYQYLHRVRVPAGTVITNVCHYIGLAGATVTGSILAVYEADGTRAGITADQGSAWHTAGAKSAALTTPVAAQNGDRWVWVGITFASADTNPGLALNSAIIVGAANLNNSPLAAGYIYAPSGHPASITLTAMTTYYDFWVGIS